MNVMLFEVVILVGMLKGFGIYNLIDYLVNVNDWKNIVLSVMEENGKIIKE